MDGRADYDADYDHGRCAQALEKRELEKRGKARERGTGGAVQAKASAEDRAVQAWARVKA
ncbi:hypothetical protein [Actinomyces sp. 2119]|uniref:hypothetical protein n=1 Tax=Actinomyces sp. 2119 TaxID=2321393 RepID=UPI0011C44192|nr:hypothetical protein [Actinomyces sp. 2119]